MTALPLFRSSQDTDHAASIFAVARAFVPHLGRSRKLDMRLVRTTMETCFNGTDADGAWSWRDAYDAMEAALVLQMRRLAPQLGRLEDAPAEVAVMLANLQDLTMTHTKRDEEQVALDQFSTTPALAALAAAAAQIRPGDLVLEPSAGTGILAIVAEACGATVHLNEISANRSAILDQVFPLATRTRHDAVHLPDLLTSAGAYHACVTNPPFQFLLPHLAAAIRCLATGGRLSAIVPSSILADHEAMTSLAKHGPIQLAAVFPERAFAKHGTSVETALLVLDRGEATTWSGAITRCTDLAQVAAAISTMAPRPTAQPRTFRQVAAASVLQPRARSLASGAAGKLAFLATCAPLNYRTVAWSGEGHDVGLYQAYRLGRVEIQGAKSHPSALVESGPMASVPPPAPTYRPHLPAAAVASGALSDAQLEVGIYAGEAHSRMLPGWWVLGEAAHELRLVPEGAEGAFQLRQGFFLGDGTGCGKGRSSGGQVIADNMAQGRMRHLWISKNEPLIEDARRDWKALGGSASDITPLSAWKLGEKIVMESGILFTTYATLRQAARGGKSSRLDQVVEWLGADFDGVIIFDEAHAMAKAIGGEGSRGLTKPSLQGQAGLALQNRLPNARVVYVSATGATTPENLAYASRLGLWGGPEAPFTTREEFLNAVEKGGVCVMEVIARELKAMGLYMARSLSFEGVEYEPLRHELTPEDVEIWDAWADAYQLIHANLQEALKASGVSDEDGKAKSGQAKSAVMSAFEGSKLRFFAALLSGIKAPSIVKEIKEQILPAGKSAVVQIVSTNEAVMERRLKDIPPEEWQNLSVDLSPKEYVLSYLLEAFPIQKMEEIRDDEDNVTLRPLTDDNGAPVVCQEALALREELVTHLACLPSVPSVLDAILDGVGVDNVAEITGRSRRVVTRKGRRVLERRGAHAAKTETDAFMSGAKRVLVFSDAGGTGRSYHADLNVPNQEPRVHLLAEAGWRADAAIQGLGRSHRTNQACPPTFRPCTTDIQGEKRFLSTISRRLDSLGALTKGDRKTAGNGLFSANDNLESPWALQALDVFYSNLYWGTASCMTAAEFEAKTGLSLSDNEGSKKSSDNLPPMHTWLNRVLALRIADQNAIFEDFQAILDSIIERATESGSLDRGVEDIAAEDVTLVSEEVIRTDTATGAETRLLNFDIRTRREIMQADEAIEWAPAGSSAFYVNEKTGDAAIGQKGLTMTDAEGRLMKGVRLFRPLCREMLPASAFRESAWKKVEEGAWRAAWNREIMRTDPWIIRSIAMVTGLLLPIWTKIPGSASLVRRLKAPDGRRWLGRVLDPYEVPKLRLALGLSDVAEIAADAPGMQRLIMEDNGEIQLAENLWLKRSLFMGRYRLEVVNGAAQRAALKAMGCFLEIANFTPRIFCPVDAGAETLGAILRKWPAVNIETRGRAA